MALMLQADLEKFLQIVFDNQPEAVVTYLIEGADSLVKDYLGFDPEEAIGESEIHDPTYTFDLWIRRPPIAAVTSVTVDGTALAATAYTVYLSGEDKSGLIRRIDGQRWSGARRGIVVVYDAGYAVADMPKTIRDASVRIVARAFQQGAAFAAEGNVPGVRSIALSGSDSVTWSDRSDDVAMGALELTGVERVQLARYKRDWVA